ncbi:MAG: rhamnulokinase [Clostridiales bacterium]|nr:rhamnulokinase [Clostridiales bacterium]
MEEQKYYIAIDIGASSGKHFALWKENEKIHMEEIYRFENKPYEEDGHLYWDMELIFSNVLEGLRKAKNMGKEPVSIGIDTWGMDYVMMNRAGDPLGETFAFRDKRTLAIFKQDQDKSIQKQCYPTTGIRYFPFTTACQLIADKRNRPNIFYGASRLAMVPEYLMFRLTGESCSEYTNGTTTGLVNVHTRKWDKELLEKLELPENLFLSMGYPGETVGEVLPEIVDEIGYETKVVLVATHDTASAVMGIPLEENQAYISSGTLSVLGTEQKNAILTQESFAYDLSNQGGYNNTYRLEKTIIALWIIQSLRLQQGEGKTFEDLIALAEEEINFPSRVNINDASFIAPADMGKAIDEYCKKTDQPQPKNLGQRLACMYHSLVIQYKETIKQLETLRGKPFEGIRIVGGGSQDRLLNQLTANACEKPVFAGPVEATGLGNGLCQMIHDGAFSSLQEARKAVKDSFSIQEFLPKTAKKE